MDRVHQRRGEQLVHVGLESLDCANNGKLTLNYLQFHGSKMCITLHSTTFLAFNTVHFTFSTRTAQEMQAMHIAQRKTHYGYSMKVYKLITLITNKQIISNPNLLG